MRRATTPTHTFTFPQGIKVGSVTEALVTYSQCGRIVLEKTLSDAEIDSENNRIAIKLSEEETNLFAPGKALVQVRAKVNEAMLASQLLWFPVKPVLNSESM